MNALPGEPMSNDTFHDAASSAPGDFDNNGYAFGTKNASFSYNTDSEKEEIYYQTAEGQEESKTAAAQTQRKIIYSSYYNIQTTQFEEAITALDALCEKYGAYYERSDTYGNAEYGQPQRLVQHSCPGRKLQGLPLRSRKHRYGCPFDRKQ